MGLHLTLRMIGSVCSVGVALSTVAGSQVEIPLCPPIPNTVPTTRETFPRLRIPVAGVQRGQLHDTFADPRSGGRRHEALDISAPHGTPVLAASDGHIVRLFYSQAGGITLYQLNPARTLVSYYAHLERYAEGIQEGQQVRQGEVVGYVGATGNASPEHPHLHFALWQVCDPYRFWHGTPINPYPLLHDE
jgi:peptidoglycan LD-endopeptidase LytH